MIIKLRKFGYTLSLAASVAILAGCGDTGEATGNAGSESTAIIDTGAATGAATDVAVGTPANPEVGVPASTAPATATPAEATPAAPATITAVDTSEAAIIVDAVKAGTSNGDSDVEFDFPEIAPVAGGLSITIPDGALPAFGARRTLINGNGPSIEFGDAVVLKYDMFSWTNGALVESSSQLDGPYAVRAGVSDNIPEYLAKSLLGRRLGETVQVVFPVGMEDLPDYMNPDDAYVLIMELL